MKTFKLKNTLKVLACSIALFQLPALANDPVTSYVVEGNTVGNWKMSIGNALNYYIPVKDGEAKTPKGNLTVSKVDRNATNDALRLKWKGKKVKNQWGGNTLNNSFVAIGKHNINIAEVEDFAALAIELKINRKPTEEVTFALQCNHSNKCGGKLPIKNQLKKAPQKEWTELSFPLNCFNKKGKMDFSNVTQVASISTQGKLEIELGSMGLVALPPGSTGCKK